MRSIICRRFLLRNGHTFKTEHVARSLHKTSFLNNLEENENSRPLQFSTSKASHRKWTVGKSMGSEHQQPLRKVLPTSIILMGILLWCFLRKETEVDKLLHTPVSELSEQDGNDVQTDKNKET